MQTLTGNLLRRPKEIGTSAPIVLQTGSPNEFSKPKKVQAGDDFGVCVLSLLVIALLAVGLFLFFASEAFAVIGAVMAIGVLALGWGVVTRVISLC